MEKKNLFPIKEERYLVIFLIVLHFGNPFTKFFLHPPLVDSWDWNILHTRQMAS